MAPLAPVSVPVIVGPLDPMPIPDVAGPSVAGALQRIENAIRDLHNAVRDQTDVLRQTGGRLTATARLTGVKPDPIEEENAGSEAHFASKPPKNGEDTRPDVAAATIATAGKVGAAKVKAVLGRFGAKKAGDIAEADIPRYLKALDAIA